jgi:hypothetical protein
MYGDRQSYCDRISPSDERHGPSISLVAGMGERAATAMTPEGITAISQYHDGALSRAKNQRWLTPKTVWHKIGRMGDEDVLAKSRACCSAPGVLGGSKSRAGHEAGVLRQ